MPQVDFVTSFLIIFWFCFFLFIGFIFFNINFLTLLIYQKKNTIKIENFKIILFLQKKFLFGKTVFEKKLNIK